MNAHALLVWPVSWESDLPSSDAGVTLPTASSDDLKVNSLEDTVLLLQEIFVTLAM